MQKGAPSLAWWPAPLDHVLSYARLCDLKPELEQFAVDARRSPQRVLDANAPDRRAEVALNCRPPSPRARFPTPVAAKTGPLPTNECLRLNDGENPQDRRTAAVKLDQEQTIEAREMDPAAYLTP